MGQFAVPAAMTGGSFLLNKLFGSTPTATQGVPPQLQGMQQSQIDMLQRLLSGGGQGNALSGISGAFGNLGVPQSDLQRQSVGGISQFLNQPSPEMRALNISMPAINEMLTGTGPQFERDIGMANQQGARFGSGNAIMRGEALRNLFNMRNQTMNTLGMLSGQAGKSDFERLLGGFDIGKQQAQQGDIGLQRLLQLFGGLTGLRQQMVGGLPITQQPGFGTQLGQGLMGLLPFLMGGGMRPQTDIARTGATTANVAS